MSVFISPSIMCCEFDAYDAFIKSFEDKKIEVIHFDVMDGHYVDNIMLGTNTYKELKKKTDIPVDLHFMCESPERYIDMFQPVAGDWVCFHPETTHHPHALLQKIKSLGCKAGYVLNPGTPLSYLDEVLDLLDYIMIMSVNPGFAGQTMVDSHLDKLSRISKVVEKSGRKIDIIIDGNTTPDNGRNMVKHGATGLVVGTSSLLKDVDNFNNDYETYIRYINQGREKV
ncbi:MAG: ribulose-phosphate 3-epimerase [Erysipelothrix sp.]|nr:ribulose-phosphate 3-epimerase [Erysipelothrix sp.]